MDEKKRKTIFFIGAIFVAIIFITSYAAFSNNNNGTAQQTTTVKPTNTQTFFVYGTANAVISNYSYIAIVGQVPANDVIPINTTLNSLQQNGTISYYSYSNSTYKVVLSSISTYQLYLDIKNYTETDNVIVGGTAVLILPKHIEAYYGATTPINVTLPETQYSAFLSIVEPINTSVPVKITALVTPNATVYQNQVKVTLS